MRPSERIEQIRLAMQERRDLDTPSNVAWGPFPVGPAIVAYLDEMAAAKQRRPKFGATAVAELTQIVRGFGWGVWEPENLMEVIDAGDIRALEACGWLNPGSWNMSTADSGKVEAWKIRTIDMMRSLGAA